MPAIPTPPDSVRLTYLVTLTLAAEPGAEALLTPEPRPPFGGIGDIVRDALDEVINRHESVIVENVTDTAGRVGLDRVTVTEFASPRLLYHCKKKDG